MTLKEVSDFLDKKIEKNERYVRITFYELRIKYNLSEQETTNFIKLAKNRLTNFGYEVYTNERNNSTLENNELLIAIKD